MFDAYKDYQSPCVNTCVIDQQTSLCRGCGRTLYEVSYWTRYTQQQRKRILQQLPARRPAEPMNPRTSPNALITPPTPQAHPHPRHRMQRL
ncbi:MAG: DUF1289 domain-containing protein [Betaproteobacteria bacterium]|nr:DUF1289 domain-containing protein [Betaproteobacteria bacterium]